MKLKALLLTCMILGLSSASKADLKQDLKARFEQAKIFVQSEKTLRNVKIGIGGCALTGGSAFTCLILSSTRKKDLADYLGLSTLIAGTISGYYMLNDGLNNKLNEAIKNLAQKINARISQLKVHEQK